MASRTPVCGNRRSNRNNTFSKRSKRFSRSPLCTDDRRLASGNSINFCEDALLRHFHQLRGAV